MRVSFRIVNAINFYSIMKISIITATFNSETTLRDTIESVLAQTFENLEYIIKDGGSKDNTLEICREYEPKFGGRMKIISESDKGLYDAINVGIRSASGDIIGILNSDDFFHRKDILETINQTFEKYVDIDAIYGDATVVSVDDINKTVRYTRSKWFRPWMFKIGLMPPHPSFYAKRECFEKFGMYNPKYKIAADFDLMTRFILLRKIKTIYLAIPILTMRDGGMSTLLSNKRLLNREVVDSWRVNGLKHPTWFVYFKYPIRLVEFFTNKSRK